MPPIDERLFNIVTAQSLVIRSLIQGQSELVKLFKEYGQLPAEQSERLSSLLLDTEAHSKILDAYVASLQRS